MLMYVDIILRMCFNSVLTCVLSIGNELINKKEI